MLNIVFAKNDKAFAVVGKDGYLARYLLPSFQLLHQSTPDLKTDKWGDFRDISFVHDKLSQLPEKPEEQLQVGVVGTDGKQ